MALEATFRELSGKLQKLHDALISLQATVGDRPIHDGSALADGVENTVLDMMGAFNEARKWCMNAHRSADHPVDLDAARSALAACQSWFHKLSEQFETELVSLEHLKRLTQLGKSRRGEWKAWANSLKQGTEECQAPLREVNRALAACWQEVAERAGIMQVSVHTTNVGQRITSRSPDARDLRCEPVT